MPEALARFCIAANCNVLVVPPSCRCLEHKREGARRDLARRGTVASMGYDARHARWRKRVLARDRVCVRCKRALATEADHVVALEDGGGWSLSNGQGLCCSCHSKKSFEDRRRRGDVLKDENGKFC